jgi:serine/threonine protein kinase
MKPKLPAPQERKALEEIVLSKSTFDSSTPKSLRQRVAWLRYELPDSLALRHSLPMVVLMGLPWTFLLFMDFPVRSIFEALIHPDYLLQLSLAFLLPYMLMSGAVLIACLVYLLNPKEFLNLWVFPDLIRIRDDLLELRWTKANERPTLRDLGSAIIGQVTGKKQWRRIRIPWHWITSVNLRDYLYMGVVPQKVLEIELGEIPADNAEWKLLKNISRDESYYLDPATNKLARKFTVGGIRLPVPLFAFSSDVNLLLENIKRKCGATVLGDISLAEDDSSQIESFTCLWLEELNSKRALDLQRLLAIGSTLQDGAYTITSVLGSGGLSVVYLANDARAGSSDNQVAIKELLCNFGGTKRSVETNLKQILSEISMLRKLEHPNIVKYRTSFAEGSRLYIVMDVVKGLNLRQYALSNPPLNEHEVLNLARQCCSILDYLHSQSPPILHRDFTPDNLMISDGVLKLIDFNISQTVVTNSARTVMGKHCFMAPEQFCGESSVASDLYQLGTTLFFIATGTDPEPLTSCELQSRRLEMSKELHSLVRKLTDRDPAKRFASAKDVAEVIESLSNPDAHLTRKAV